MVGSKVVLILSAVLLLSACGREKRVERPIGTTLQISAPLGLPPVSFPPDNPATLETISLGRKLFYDPKLSSNNTISCAFCHDPAHGFSDGRRFSLGVAGKTGTRNAPSVLNSAYASTQFWDGRAASLEEQAAGPIANPIEMNQTHEVFVEKLNADPAYVSEFTKAFGPGRITMSKVQKALASFERTALSGNSPFDRYQFGGERTALSPSALRGFEIFKSKSKGNCVTCHATSDKFALFTDGKFHNIGVGVNVEGELTDLGRFRQTGVEAHKGAFRTPTLRNLARSAPYMHDGSLRTLKEVVDFYVGGGNSNPYLDPEIKPLDLTRNERDDLVSFLEALNGEVPSSIGPPPAK